MPCYTITAFLGGLLKLGAKGILHPQTSTSNAAFCRPFFSNILPLLPSLRPLTFTHQLVPGTSKKGSKALAFAVNIWRLASVSLIRLLPLLGLTLLHTALALGKLRGLNQHATINHTLCACSLLFTMGKLSAGISCHVILDTRHIFRQSFAAEI